MDCPGKTLDLLLFPDVNEKSGQVRWKNVLTPSRVGAKLRIRVKL
ncbi:hypothetical protein THTE_1787 [Thermogutta terrifontis]|uniref:Uncharacterized protein n=1 Tax=Thermogutta terrifontis TaxID=1331910 RepID=A0A286REJ9_9BACT|nr:hypothetical protein THTE_1787 [Thermogutta terrifontis]